MELNQRIEAASFNYLIGNSFIPLVGSAAGATAIAISQIATGGGKGILVWLLAIYIVIGVRAWLTQRCKAQLLANGYCRADAIRYSLTICLSGFAWGAALLALQDATTETYLIAITVTQAMVMGGVVTLAVYIPAFLAFALPAILPMIAVFAIEGNTTSTILAICSAIFLTLMLGVAFRFNRSLRNAWQLQFENDDLVTALTNARDKLAVQAKSDGLTGLANRRHFDEVLETECARLRRSGAPLSLIFLDVDYFKAFNDSYGHVTGDECLQKIAFTLQELLLRAPDFVARYGGEEFAVILPETDNPGAVAIAEQIRVSVANLAIPHSASSVNPCVTVSLGVVTLDCSRIRSTGGILSLVDRQLYMAKANGRNRIESLNTLDLSAKK